MRTLTNTILEEYDLTKITKIILNKTMESETIVEGVIIKTDDANTILRGVEDSGKGKPLREKKEIEGTFLMLLDKNNFKLLEEANYEFVQSYKMKSETVKDLFKVIEESNGKYIVEL